MADTPIDKLVFALGGDVAPLNEAFKQAEAGAARTGKAINDNLGAGFKAAAGDAATHAQRVASGLKDVAGHAEKIGSHIQVSRRELIYFFRELANGDVQRLPATMALFLSHLLELSPAAIAVSAAVAAIPLAVSVAAVKADMALAKLRTSLALTANASGISLSQATVGAEAAAGPGRLSVMGAQDIMGGLIGGGMPRSLLTLATAAAGSYSLATGATHEDATATVRRMWEDPAKAADELNRAMHLLTAEQTEQVRHLNAQGQQEEAAAIVLREFKERTEDAAREASAWSKALNRVGNDLGNFGHWLGIHAFGTGSPQDRLDMIRAAEERQKMVTGHVSPSLLAQDKELSDQIAQSKRDAEIKGNRAKADDAVGKALQDADKGAGSFQAHLKDLRDELGRDQWAVNQANTAHAAFSLDTLKRITDARDAAKIAAESYEKYGAPGMAEKRQAGYAAELARTPIEREDIVRRQQQAREQRIQELMNPATALQAEQNYKVAMGAASYADAEILKRQQRRIEAMDTEAKTSGKVAAAYGVSAAAVARATAEGDVDIMVTERQINAKDRLRAIHDKLTTAINQTSQAIGKQVRQAGIENAAGQLELAAGGNPLALMHATAAATAFKATEGAFQQAAGNPAAQAGILGQRRQLTDAEFARAQADAQKSALGNLYSAQANLAGQRALYGAQTSGLSEDDLRRFQVWQQLVMEFNRQGLDPSIEANRRLFQQTLQTNIALSDLADEMEKTAREASGLATDITGGLRNILDNPSGDWQQGFANIGRNMLSTIVQSNILDPMNKWLTGAFSNMIGGTQGPLALGSADTNPMWVTMVGANGMPGGGGGLGDFMSMFGFSGGGGGGSGISQAFADANILSDVSSSLGDLSMLAMLPGLAKGGYKSPQDYVWVGENGPEILGPGIAGYVTPPRVSAALGTNGGGQGSNTSIGDMHFHLPNVQDPAGFIRSKSQISSAVTRAAGAGRRNN